jgi:hypothetical protein
MWCDQVWVQYHRGLELGNIEWRIGVDKLETGVIGRIRNNMEVWEWVQGVQGVRDKLRENNRSTECRGIEWKLNRNRMGMEQEWELNRN